MGGKALYSLRGPSQETMRARLAPARCIIAAGIPCILWAADAMSFAHQVYYMYFLELQLLVPDTLVLSATQALERSSPYRRTDIAYPGFVEPDSEPSNAYPDAVLLKYTQE